MFHDVHCMEQHIHATVPLYAGGVTSRRGAAAKPSDARDESLADRVARVAPTLTAAERRVADVVLGADRVVAFGTVAAVAEAAGAGAATVVRTAAKLGFSGFTDLQAELRRGFGGRAGLTGEHVSEGEPGGAGGVDAVLEMALLNLRRTLEAVDMAAVESLADEVADLRHDVVVVAGEKSRSIAEHLACELGALRPRVSALSGNPVAVAGALAQYERGDLILVVGLRPYDHWLVGLAHEARARGLRTAVITDSALSPLVGGAPGGGGAEYCFVVSCASAGPFASHVGVVVLSDLIVTTATQRLRRVATDRLERAESARRRCGVLIES